MTVVDETLWARALSGDGGAFGAIFDRHRARVRRHAIGLVPVPADADDVLAVVFLEAWRKRSAIRFVDGSMLPWLLRTATYTASNFARSSRRYREALQRLPAAPEVTAETADGSEANVFGALHELALPDRQVITLCVLEELTTEDDARVLGVRPGTVRTRLTRAKARLRERLEHEPNPLPTEGATRA